MRFHNKTLNNMKKIIILLSLSTLISIVTAVAQQRDTILLKSDSIKQTTELPKDTAKIEIIRNAKSFAVKALTPKNAYVRNPGNGDNQFYIFVSSNIVEFVCNDLINKIWLSKHNQPGIVSCYSQQPSHKPKQDRTTTHDLAPNPRNRRNWIELVKLDGNTQVVINLNGDSINEQRINFRYTGARGGIDKSIRRISFIDSTSFEKKDSSVFATDTFKINLKEEFLIPTLNRTNTQDYNVVVDSVLFDGMVLPFKVKLNNTLQTDSCSDDILYGASIIPLVDSLLLEKGLHTVTYNCIVLTNKGPQKVSIDYFVDFEDNSHSQPNAYAQEVIITIIGKIIVFFWLLPILLWMIFCARRWFRKHLFLPIFTYSRKIRNIINIPGKKSSKQHICADEKVAKVIWEYVKKEEITNTEDLRQSLENIGVNKVINEWRKQDTNNTLDDNCNYTVESFITTIGKGYVGNETKDYISYLLQQYNLNDKFDKGTFVNLIQLIQEASMTGPKPSFTEITDDQALSDEKVAKVIWEYVKKEEITNTEDLRQSLENIGVNKVINEWRKQDTNNTLDDNCNYTVESFITTIGKGYVGNETKDYISYLLQQYNLNDKFDKGTFVNLIQLIQKASMTGPELSSTEKTDDQALSDEEIAKVTRELIRVKIVKDSEELKKRLLQIGINEVVNKWNSKHKGKDSLNRNYRSLDGLMKDIQQKTLEKIHSQKGDKSKSQIEIAQVYITAIDQDWTKIQESVETNSNKPIFKNNVIQIIEDLNSTKRSLEKATNSETSYNEQLTKEKLLEILIQGLRKTGWINKTALLLCYSRIPQLANGQNLCDELVQQGLSVSLLERICANIEALLGKAGVGIVMPAVLANNFNIEDYDYENADIWIDKFFPGLNLRNYQKKVFDIVQVGYTINGELIKKPVVQY